MKKPAAVQTEAECSEREIIRQLQERTDGLEASLKETEQARARFETWYHEAQAKNRSLTELTGKLKEQADTATAEAQQARRDRLSVVRQLAFAQGFIAALKGEPYPATPDGPLDPWRETNDISQIFRQRNRT